MGLLSRAAVASVFVHLAVLGALLRGHVVSAPPRAAPIEVELRFRAPEARRVVPQPVSPAVRNGAAGPRRAVRRVVTASATTSSATPTDGVPTSDPTASQEAELGEPGIPNGAPDGGGRQAEPSAPPTEPALLSLPRIDYPPRALMDEIEGVVRLDVHLSAEGRVLSVEVLESPTSELAVAARGALMGARFRPATRDGKAIESRFPYRYRFELR